MFRRKRVKLTTVFILALMLTIALASVAAAQAPDQPPPPDPPADPPASGDPPPPPGGNGAPPVPSNGAPPIPGDEAPPPSGHGDLPPPGNGNINGSGMMAPTWPPPGLIVTHAATQVQLTPAGDGLQSYLIGADGKGHSGPYIASFAKLAQMHAGAATLWTGANPGTGKPVTIDYLPAENKLRISTFYPDNQYDVNKPYVFTVDPNHNVLHEQW